MGDEVSIFTGGWFQDGGRKPSLTEVATDGWWTDFVPDDDAPMGTAFRLAIKDRSVQWD